MFRIVQNHQPDLSPVPGKWTHTQPASIYADGFRLVTFFAQIFTHTRVCVHIGVLCWIFPEQIFSLSISEPYHFDKHADYPRIINYCICKHEQRQLLGHKRAFWIIHFWQEANRLTNW